MLNVFPEFLAYGLLAPFILRLVSGMIFINLGRLKFKGEKDRWSSVMETLRIRPAVFFVKLLGIIQILSGLMFVVGIYTQVAAIILAIISLAEIYVEYRTPEILKRNIVFYLLLFAISLSLLFSGAGKPAIDWPL